MLGAGETVRSSEEKEVVPVLNEYVVLQIMSPAQGKVLGTWFTV